MLSQVEKFEILNKKINILCKVKNDIDINLDPSSKSFSNNKSIQEALSSIEITQDDYYWTLFILPETDYQIHLKRSPGSQFVSNCNPVMLKAWEANLDIQPATTRYSDMWQLTFQSQKVKFQKP